MKKSKIVITLISIVCVAIICTIVSILFFRNAQIKKYCTQLNHIYSNFIKAEDILDKDKIFNKFIKTTDGNKHSKVEETYEKILLDMKAEISNDIEKEIKTFSAFDFENKTKFELNNEIENLNAFAEKIKIFKNSVSSENSEKYQKQINELISSYKNKIEKIEKKEKERIEAEKSAKKKAEETRKNNVNASSKNNSAKNKNTYSNNKIEQKNETTQNTHKKRIDITNPNEYTEHHWLHDNGVKIKKSDTYVDKYGNVYDYKGYFLYNLSEWLDVVE